MIGGYDTSDVYFKSFAKSLTAAIGRIPKTDEVDRLHTQRRQLKSLIASERKLQDQLWEVYGASVYDSFITYICTEKRNILSSRPFFRERQERFSAEISQLFKDRNGAGLHPYKLNYQFAKWVLNSAGPTLTPEIRATIREIEKMRVEIMTMNLPLAISYCRTFWNQTPRSHMSFLDLIQTHTIGLQVAIDKFNPNTHDNMTNEEELAAYKVFRSVALGRMCGDRIEAYNSTLLHLWPVDARRVYRAHKASRFLDKNADIDLVVAAVNENIPEKYHVTGPEIQGLLAAASHVSGDCAVDQETGDTTLECYMDDEEHRPDVIVERTQALATIHAGLKSLSVVEQKMLRLKGITLS